MPIIDIPQITGTFTHTATARYESIGYGIGWTIIDIGESGETDNIVLAQSGASRTVAVVGNGVMSLSKNGAVIGQGQGNVPADMARLFVLVGEGNRFAADALNGEVSAVNYEDEDLLATARVDRTDTAADDTFGVQAMRESVTILDFGADDAADRVDVSALSAFSTIPKH